MSKRITIASLAGMLTLSGLAFGLMGFTNNSQTCPLEGTPACPKVNCSHQGTPQCPYETTAQLPACCQNK